MKIPKIIILAILVSLLIGCRHAVKLDPLPAIPKLSCEPIPYPKPITWRSLQAGQHFKIYKDRIELTPEGWSIAISWQHEAERYGIGAVALQKYMEDCINEYNSKISNQ